MYKKRVRTHKHHKHDINLTSLTGACPISAPEHIKLTSFSSPTFSSVNRDQGNYKGESVMTDITYGGELLYLRIFS